MFRHHSVTRFRQCTTVDRVFITKFASCTDFDGDSDFLRQLQCSLVYAPGTIHVDEGMP
ncbi:TPA: hypothetical protein JZF83_004955 [Escherichia coli]|nr:hypothetical protein [Escherichia coli]